MPTMEGDVDICEVIEDDSFPEVPAFLAAYGVENKCPVPGPVSKNIVQDCVVANYVCFIEKSLCQW